MTFIVENVIQSNGSDSTNEVTRNNFAMQHLTLLKSFLGSSIMVFVSSGGIGGKRKSADVTSIGFNRAPKNRST